MASPEILVNLEAKATQVENLTAEIKAEIIDLRKLLGALKLDVSNEALKVEKERLKKEINEYKQILTNRVGNDICIGQTTVRASASEQKSPLPAVKASSNVNKESQELKKEKSPKPEVRGNVEVEGAEKPKKKAPPKPAATAADEPPIDVGRLDFRVGKIVDVKKHPDADSLYLEQIDVGEDKPRTVVSGLVKFVPIEEMEGRMVVALCNLKPAKMRGVMSEAMVMCASTPEKVEVLIPPPGSAPGDLIHVEGFARVPDPVLNPKKKIFETVAPDLRTNSSKVATFKGVPWTVPGKGVIITSSLVDVNIK